MNLKNIVLVGVCLLIFSVAPPLRAQGGCASAPDAAVQCFVGNAVRTQLVTLQYGMTMAQFKAYGVSVSKIVQQQPTALAVVALASAVADALPPTNADGSANLAAQTAAINSIVDAGIANNFLILPAETTSQDLKWFSLDLVNLMNTNNGILLSPGTMLRVIDSYVVTAPTSGTERAIGSDLKRSNTPFAMSAFMFCPIEMLLIAIVWPIRPGSRNWR